MDLANLIIAVLQNSNRPLKQGEIFELIKNHPEYSKCPDIQKVKVPMSAVARCLSKYSSGSAPIFGISDASKQSQKSYFLKNSQSKEIRPISEADMHPILAKFAAARFNVFSKTINAMKVLKRKNKMGKWTNPDIVGINPVILNLNPLFQAEVEKLGILSTKTMQFYSFELKLKIDKSNITECYFQTVSNSNWANFGYLVVSDLDADPMFMSNLTRLNNGYGIGIIKLNIDNAEKSEIIISAREREIADINFMNFLSEINSDFYDFIENARAIVDAKNIDISKFDAF
jgi:hypothetical protein